MRIEKVRQRTFLHDIKSPDYRYQHMRANAWEEIGKELQIKHKFYVSSRDVRIVCLRFNWHGKSKVLEIIYPIQHYKAKGTEGK